MTLTVVYNGIVMSWLCEENVTDQLTCDELTKWWHDRVTSWLCDELTGSLSKNRWVHSIDRHQKFHQTTDRATGCTDLPIINYWPTMDDVPNPNPNHDPGQCCRQSFRCRWLRNYASHPPACLHLHTAHRNDHPAVTLHRLHLTVTESSMTIPRHRPLTGLTKHRVDL